MPARPAVVAPATTTSPASTMAASSTATTARAVRAAGSGREPLSSGWSRWPAWPHSGRPSGPPPGPPSGPPSGRPSNSRQGAASSHPSSSTHPSASSSRGSSAPPAAPPSADREPGSVGAGVPASHRHCRASTASRRCTTRTRSGVTGGRGRPRPGPVPVRGGWGRPAAGLGRNPGLSAARRRRRPCPGPRGLPTTAPRGAARPPRPAGAGTAGRRGPRPASGASRSCTAMSTGPTCPRLGGELLEPQRWRGPRCAPSPRCSTRPSTTPRIGLTCSACPMQRAARADPAAAAQVLQGVDVEQHRAWPPRARRRRVGDVVGRRAPRRGPRPARTAKPEPHRDGARCRPPDRHRGTRAPPAAPTRTSPDMSAERVAHTTAVAPVGGGGGEAQRRTAREPAARWSPAGSRAGRPATAAAVDRRAVVVSAAGDDDLTGTTRIRGRRPRPGGEVRRRVGDDGHALGPAGS